MCEPRMTDRKDVIETQSVGWTTYRPPRRPVLLGLSVLALVIWIGFMISMI